MYYVRELPLFLTWEHVEGHYDVGHRHDEEEEHPDPEEEIQPLAAPEVLPEVPEEDGDVGQLLGQGARLA